MTVNANFSQSGNSVFENVYIYGRLHYPNFELDSITLDNATISGLTSTGNLTVSDGATFSGITTFYDKVNFTETLSFIDLEVREKLTVGIGGTVLTASSLLDPGKVGIGSTQPTEILDVLGVTSTTKLFVEESSIFSGIATFKDEVSIPDLTEDRVVFVGTGSTLTDSPDLKFYNENQTLSIAGSIGIGTTIPYGVFQANQNTKSVVVTAGGTMAIGSTTPYGTWTDNTGDGGFSDSGQGTLRLSVDGSIRISRNIYDSGDSAGVNGMFLQRDGDGIRWTAYEPSLQEGILIQDEGVFVPVNTGVAQTFSIVNFSQVNSYGTGTDTLVPTLGNASTGLATIFTNDFWGVVDGHVGLDTGIYRLTNVGIGTSVPEALFQVGVASTAFAVTGIGSVGIGSTNPVYGLDVYKEAYFRDKVTVDKHTELNLTLNVDGAATFQDDVTINADNKTFTIETEDGTDKFKVASNTGNTDIEGTLNVAGVTQIETNQAASNTTSGALQVAGGTGIVGKLFVGGDTKVESNTTSINTTSGALQVVGGTGIGENLNVGGNFKVTGVSTFNDDVTFTGSSYNAQWDKSENALHFNDNAEATFGNTSDNPDLQIYYTDGDGSNGGSVFKHSGDHDMRFQVPSGNHDIVFERSSDGANLAVYNADGAVDLHWRGTSNPGKKFATTSAGIDITGHTETDTLNVSGVSTHVGISTFKDAVGIGSTLDLGWHISDVNQDIGVGAAKTDYRLASVGTGVSWRPSGVQTKNTIWVSINGDDNNTGLLEGDSKRTIGAAAAIALAGDTIIVRSGVYNENNPIGLRTDVTVSGEDLRLVTVVPNTTNKDVFQVRRGCLIQNMNFAGQSTSTNHANCGAVAFPPTAVGISGGVDFQAVTGYTELGPANEGPNGRYRSPYVRNCTNFMTGSIGMKINGDYVNAAFTGTNDIGQDLKSMVCDSFTQYNENGIGVSLTNNAYAQLVSIFTIGCDIAIFAGSGGQCDLTNSNSSFGNVGLKADGVGAVEFTSKTNTSSIGGQDVIELANVRDVEDNIRKPFDGQGAYFYINMDDYADSIASGVVNKPLQFIRSIDIIDGGSGYNPGSPPNITVNAPQGPESIIPEFSANVSAAGSISSIDVIASGRNFLPDQELTVTFSSGNATAKVNTDPILFTVDSAEEPSITGLSTVTFNEFIPYSVGAGVSCEFVRLSRIITSSHSFEYVGAGTDLNIANPFQGGEPIPENEIIAINGGQVPFTSTDQKGNFRIGDGLTIDQTTSTIRGRDFNRAIQAQLTPLILALR
jgi:hypothetical protein